MILYRFASERHKLTRYYLFFGGFSSVMRWFWCHDGLFGPLKDTFTTRSNVFRSRRINCQVVCVCVFVFVLCIGITTIQKWDAVLSHFSKRTLSLLSLSFTRRNNVGIMFILFLFKNQSFFSWESFFSLFDWALEFVKFNLSFDWILASLKCLINLSFFFVKLCASFF